MVLSAAVLASRFPSIPLDKPIVGLYFAASWCPDCTEVTSIVAHVLGKTAEDWNVVYIASDNTQEQLDSFAPASFAKVPFENWDERSNLKRHFGVCAAKEVESLGMTPDERKSGIPTLIVLESSTGKIVTMDGVQNVMDSNESAVENWKKSLSSQD
jgi:nucleoredoxin